MTRGRAQDDSAVSPVVGTILMVAIAVVLSGVMFILTTQIGKGKDSPPEMAFVRDEQNDRLMITKIAPVIARGEYEIRMSRAGDFDVDAQVGAGADVASANAFVALAGAPGGPAEGQIEPGSYISFCVETGNPGTVADGVLVELRHAKSNSIVWKDTFLTLADCPT